ncbi:MAG TPA: AMP-binding protein, partial [Frankiaceae bacterium]|nr:AMP-binding protein [Frankiaceae bacterium]
AQLPWTTTWTSVYEGEPPSYRWFAGGRTNLGANCVDRHASGPNAGRVALAYRNERGDAVDVTYAELDRRVRQASAALRGVGVGHGDRVTLYMPPCVESIVMMLACARIGAIHCVVFAGFGSGALADRIDASGSRWLFTVDSTYRRGSDVDLTKIVDEALEVVGDKLDQVVTVSRSGGGRSWEQFLAAGAGQDDAAVEMEANEPAFILATSGTTARPKLVVHTHGGYQVAVHHGGDVCYGLDGDDVWWATSDIGWIVGHSYIVYAPLLAGATTVVYEGSIDYPAPDVLWRLIAELKVTGVFTSPTAVRLLVKYGEQHARGHDLSSLRRVVCAGEVLNPAAYDWLATAVLEGRVPVLDNMWQTEMAAPIFANAWGSGLPVKPGSAGLPVPGTIAAVVDADGVELPTGQPGIMVLRRPTPGLTASLWEDPDRYAGDYWGRIPGCYYVGDAARFDEDGYVWFAGRADEVLKIAAHRIGTIEVESALLTHPAVAEAGVTGRPDDLRGEVISAFVVLKAGVEEGPELVKELTATLRREIGPVAVLGDCRIVSALPKTRSGKIMRRVLKAVVLGVEPGDVTTIEDEASVDEARAAWKELGAADLPG